MTMRLRQRGEYPGSGRVMAVMVMLAMYPASAETAIDKTPPPEPVVDPAPCLSAISANDDDAVIEKCAALIGYAKALVPDRIKALAARAAAYARKDQADRAIADYDVALTLDPRRADLFNARGALWRQKGDRPRAVQDFSAALRLDPQNDTARSNLRALALEIEKIGADMALKNMSKGQPKPPLK